MEILRSTNEYVIRFKVSNGQLVLAVHRFKDGVELQPRGYMAGNNYLSFDLK